MRRLLPLLLLCACAEKAPEAPRFPKALALAAAPATSVEPPQTQKASGKLVPVLVQRSLVPDEVMNALPPERRAASDEDAGSVARIDCRSESMGSYSDGVPAYRSSCTVSVLDLKSGAITARKLFPGKVPPQARQDSSGFSSMTPPDYPAIAAWLAALPLK